ncbi:hypothetical protein, partial [Trichothermofontia sp.]
YAPPAPARIAVDPPQPQARAVERTLIVEGDSGIQALSEEGVESPSLPASPAVSDAPTPTNIPTVGAAASATGGASALGGPLVVSRADLQDEPTPKATRDDRAADTVAPSPFEAQAAADYPVDTETPAAPSGPVMAPPMTVTVPYPASACPIAATGGYTTVETDAQGNIIAGPAIELGHPDLNAAARSAVLAQPRSLGGAAVYQYDLSVSGQEEVCGE